MESLRGLGMQSRRRHRKFLYAEVIDVTRRTHAAGAGGEAAGGQQHGTLAALAAPQQPEVPVPARAGEQTSLGGSFCRGNYAALRRCHAAAQKQAPPGVACVPATRDS